MKQKKKRQESTLPSEKKRKEIAKYFPDNFSFDEACLLSVIDKTLEELAIKNRKKDNVKHRQLLAVYLFMQNYTLEEVADIIERDHCTVIHSIKCFLNAAEGFDQDFFNMHLQILREIPHSLYRYQDINVNEAICLVNLDFLMKSKVA